jgi:hypothetical protein
MNRLRYILLFCVIVAVYITYYVLQPYIDYTADILYDGKKYLKIAYYFMNEATSYSIDFPFNSRIGVPFVVSFFSDHLITFSVLNIISLVLFFCILVYFLIEYTGAKFAHITFVLLWLSLHYIGPVRYYIHDPVSIDLQIMVVETLVVLSFFKKRGLSVVFLAVIGVFIKESIIPLLVVLALSSYLFFNKDLLKSILSALIITIVIKVILGFEYPMAVPNWKYNSVITLLYRLKVIFLHPLELLQWLTSLLFIGSLFLVKIKRVYKLSSEQKTILLLAFYGLGISLLGGGDYSRLLFVSSVYIFTSLLLFMREVDSREFMFLLLGSVPFMRINYILPRQYSYKTYPEHFDVLTCVVWLAYFLIVLVVCKMYWDRKKV